MSTLNSNPIAKAVRTALLAGTAAALAMPAAYAAEDEEGEKVVITGSRIKRTDVETALPVTVIDREAIEASGQINAADLLRNTTFNSFGSIRPQSGSSAQAVSSISVRGIGADRTLVLVDGRRLAKSPSTGSTQDLNQIPIAAIERVEILSDGASAIYGSDAIGGVVNIITRKDFNGVEMKIGKQSIEHEGGDRENGSVLFGASSADSSILAGVSINHRDIVFARDFPWYNPGASVYGNSFTTITNGADDFNWTAIPGGCSGSEGFYIVSNPNAVNADQTRCAFNFALVSADEASIGNQSLFVNATHDINPNWSTFANMSIAKTDSFGRYAPVPDSSYFSTPLTEDSPNNPTNPNNVDIYVPGTTQGPVNWWHRFEALGNRDNEVENSVMDLNLGFNGYIGEVEVEFGVRRTKAKTFDIGRNYLVRTTAAAFIEDGTYDLQNPFQNPDDVLNAMKATISRISHFNQEEIYGNAAFDLFNTNAGTSQMFVGFETRELNYNDQYDSLSEAGAIGGSAGNSAGGKREHDSIFFENVTPLTDQVELQVAGRFDEYSDSGSDFSPKVAVSYRPTDDLLLRASYGQGFRAPGLDILTQKDSFSADSIRDDQTCAAFGTCPVQINGTRTANPNLESENSDQFAFGVVYEPFDWLNMNIDYWSIEIEDRIKFFDAQTLVDYDNAGIALPSGLSVSRNAQNGAITNIIQGYGNEGFLKTDGVDLNVRTNFDFGAVGSLKSYLQVGYIFKQEVDDIDADGNPVTTQFIHTFGAPRYRASISNVYSISDINVTWNINYIDQTSDSTTDPDSGGQVTSWTTHDLQFSYNTAWDGRIDVGARNITGKQPPLVPFGSRDYNFNLYDGYGRIVYANYTQTF